MPLSSKQKISVSTKAVECAGYRQGNGIPTFSEAKLTMFWKVFLYDRTHYARIDEVETDELPVQTGVH